MEWYPSHVMTVQDEIVKIFNGSYTQALKNAYWDKLVVEKPSSARVEYFESSLSTAKVEDLPEGQMLYGDLATVSQPAKPRPRGQGLQLSELDFLNDKLGVVAQWAAEMGSAIALEPQYMLLDLYAKSETVKAYDGIAYHGTAHPVNPKNPALGTYDSLITTVSQVSAAAIANTSATPATTDACDLRGYNGVPNLAVFAAVVAYVRKLLAPNGRSRNLKPSILVHGPNLTFTARTITGAQFISATVNAVAQITGEFTDYNIVPLEIPEITDNSWGLVTSVEGVDLKPVIHTTRAPYRLTAYTPEMLVDLSRKAMLEWNVRGYADAVFYNPFQWIKVKVA